MPELARALPAGAIDVWHLACTPAHADLDLLDPTEAERAARFLSADKRVQFIAGRAQLRAILAGYLGLGAKEVRFEYGEHGKPTLAAGTGDLAFNLSHSHDRGLLAITTGADLRLGVDIELARPGRRFGGIATRFFAAQEARALLELPAARQPAAFYRAWTRKEAYLKAWGTGLSFASNRFWVSFDEAGPSRLLASEMPGEEQSSLDAWHFISVAASGGFTAALCYPGARRWLRHFAPST
jgi:4'-phosphopantetheinyl transferase